MGPWSDARSPSTRSAVRFGAPEAWLIAMAAGLLLFGAAVLWLNRYEMGQAGGLPVRLNRITGEVIACVPKQGCFALIPAGDPTLGTLRETLPPGQAPAATAPPAAAPAAQAPEKPAAKKP